MKRMALIVAMVLTAGIAAAAQTPNQPPQSARAPSPAEGNRSQPAAQENRSEQELLRLERAWLDAYEQRDTAAMERILADDFTITFGNGQTEDKAQTIANLRRPADANQVRFRTEETRVRLYGETAILSGFVLTLRVTDGREEVVSRARYTDTYARLQRSQSPRQTRWQVVASHLSQLPRQRTAATVEAGIYEAYAGEYETAPGRTLVLARDGNTLTAQPAGGPRIELLPESETRFFARGMDVRVTFVRDGEGRATHLILQEGCGDARVARKVR